MTVNGYTEDEDFAEAALVVVERSATRRRAGTGARRTAARRAPGDWVSVEDLEACLGDG